MFALIGIDVAAIALSALFVVALTNTVGTPHHSASVLALSGVCFVVVLVFMANGLYGRRFMRHSVRRLARASLMAIVVVAAAAYALGYSLDHLAAALTIVLAAALAFAARAAYDWALPAPTATAVCDRSRSWAARLLRAGQGARGPCPSSATAGSAV